MRSAGDVGVRAGVALTSNGTGQLQGGEFAFPAAIVLCFAALALWIAWRLSARFLDGDKRVLGLALLTLVPFFNFHALKFNSNTVLMPTRCTLHSSITDWRW